jgi:hypothetical protein
MSGSASAQRAVSPVYVRVDALATSKYVWRGLARSQYPTLQVHGALALQTGKLRLAGGAFASYEPFDADANHRTLTGVGEQGLGEADYWGEISAELGKVELATGIVHYTYHGDAALGGLSSTANTAEFFARLDARGLRFSPSVAMWVDLEDVRGTFLELRAAAPVLGWPYQPPLFITVDGELGVSLGQGPDPDGRQRANFAGDGPTHVQLGVTALLSALPWLAVSLGGRGQFGIDDSTRMGADGASRRLKGWVTVGAVIRPVPRRSRR